MPGYVGDSWFRFILLVWYHGIPCAPFVVVHYFPAFKTRATFAQGHPCAARVARHERVWPWPIITVIECVDECLGTEVRTRRVDDRASLTSAEPFDVLALGARCKNRRGSTGPDTVGLSHRQHTFRACRALTTTLRCARTRTRAIDQNIVWLA